MRRAAVLLVAALHAVPGVRADGMLDPSFGNGGLVVTDFSTFSVDDASSLVVLPDGRAVAGGYTSPFLGAQWMAAARYLVSGGLDTTFGAGGLVTVPFLGPPGTLDPTSQADAVLLQADGSVVLVGGFTFGPPASARFALARLNPDGSLDPSFGRAGQVTTNIGDLSTGSTGLLQPDGKIVAGGKHGFGASGTIAAARYNPDGSLDPTFGPGGAGFLLLSQFPASFQVRDLALQPDGKLLIACTYGSIGAYDLALVRLLPDGTPDPTFDGDGLVTSDFGGSESAVSVIVLGDGRIVLGGDRVQGSAVDFALVRYLPNGTVDTTFGNGGLAIADSGAAEIAGQLIRLPNGNLLVAGYADDPSGQDYLLARLLPDGALDTSFGTAGFLRTGFPGGTADQCRAVAMAGPDLVLTAGRVGGQPFPPDFGLARYIASTPVDLLSFEVE